MERLHVSVSRRSLFPLLMALFGALLCIGMVQRFRDPLYDMTLEYWLYLAAGCFMVLVGLVGMRFFPWMCIIPAVCYVYGGVIEGWSDLQANGSSGLLTQIPFYQILMLVPLILLLMIRWKPWCIWLLKGLEIIAILIPFAMAWMQLQDALLELKMEGYLTDAVKQTRWMHFLMNEAVFYAGMICMTLSLRYLPPQEPVEDTEADKDADGTIWTDANLPMALGGLTHGVTNVELCAAYAAIANNGNYIEPIYYTKILDHNGNVLIEKNSAGRSVIKESTAWLLTSAMEDVVNKGTGTACQLDNMTVAGKTGTTDAYNDLWFVGYTPYYTCAVWSGFDNNEKLPEDARNFHKNLWKKVMTRIHEGLPDKDFDMPASVEKISICEETGLLPRAGCPVITEYFDIGDVPTDYCDQHFYESDDTGEEYTTDEETNVSPTPDPDNNSNNNGDNTGGDNTGGDNTGGDNTGGDNTGGDNTGGDNTGGDNTGGDNTGGDNTGGDNAGGGDNTGGDDGGGDTGGGDDGGNTEE